MFNLCQRALPLTDSLLPIDPHRGVPDAPELIMAPVPQTGSAPWHQQHGLLAQSTSQVHRSVAGGNHHITRLYQRCQPVYVRKVVHLSHILQLYAMLAPERLAQDRTRQPEVAGDIRGAMVIVAAMIEGAAVIGLIVCMIK